MLRTLVITGGLIVSLAVSGVIGAWLGKLFRHPDKWAIFAMFPLGGILIGGYFWNLHYVIHTVSGELKEALYLDNRRLLLSEDVEVGNENGDTLYARLTLVDLETGARLAQDIPEGWHDCWIATPERLFCKVDAGFEVRDASTLAVVTTPAELAEKNPVLRTERQGAFRRDGDRALVTSDDGYRYEIDPATLTAHRFDGEPARREPPPRRPGPSYAFERMEARGRLTIDGKPVAQSFLEPTVLDDDALIAHQTSLDRKATRLRLTRIGPGGEERWTLEDAMGKPAVRRQDGRLIVVVGTNGDDPGTYVLVVEARSGKVIRRITP